MRLMTILPFIALLVFPASAAAQDNPSDNNKGLELTFGTGIVSSRSKIDRMLPAENRNLYLAGADLTKAGSKISVAGKLADGGLSRSTGLTFNGRTNGFTARGLKVGFSAEYFYARELEPLIREPEFLVDSESKKHYLLGGPDVVYGDMRTRYVRGAYLAGAAYMRIDGKFNYNNPGNEVRSVLKLYDLDTQPVHALLIEGAYANLWRLSLSGSVRYIRTLAVADHINTKNFIPLRHVVSEGSVQTRVWRSLSVSASGTFSNKDRGRIFIGNSLAVAAKIKF